MLLELRRKLGQDFENPVVQGGDAIYSCAHIAKIYALESAALVQARRNLTDVQASGNKHEAHDSAKLEHTIQQLLLQNKGEQEPRYLDACTYADTHARTHKCARASARTHARTHAHACTCTGACTDANKLACMHTRTFSCKRALHVCAAGMYACTRVHTHARSLTLSLAHTCAC